MAVLVSSAALGVAPAASADTHTPIPVAGANDTVVDGVHQRVFFSDYYRDQIVVTDYAGKVVTVFTGLPQVRDLDLSPDSGTLYAAVPGADRIVAFDTAQLVRSAEYPTGQDTEPAKLAYAEGRLWFGYGDQWDSGLGAIDLTAGTPTVTLGLAPAGHDWANQPMLLADPDNPGTLVAVDQHISSAPIVVYDISSGTPSIRVSSLSQGQNEDAALTPDGQSVVIAGPGNQALTEYRLSDLAEVRTYPLPYDPQAVSVAPDGTVAATVLDPEDIGDTYVFTGGPDKPASVRNLSRLWMPFFGHSLSWSADGGKLFVLTESEDSTRFHALDEPRKYVGTLKVSAPATATRAKPLTVSGRLTSNLGLPAGTPVTVTRTDMESPTGTSLGTRTLDADGRFSLTDAPPAGGKVTYTVRYAGNTEHTAVSASDTVEVSRATPSLTLNKDGSTYAYGADVTFTAHLGTTYKNRKLEIWADPYGSDKPNKLVKSGTVNSSGNLSATLDLTRDTKVSVKFAGDARYKPATATSRVGTKVRISSSISGYYKSQSAWNHTYYYVHQAKDPVLRTTMTYYPGRRQRLKLQAYYQGAWRYAGAEYFALGTSGVSEVTLTGTPSTNVRFRFRSEYHDTTSGDNVNTTTYGAWKYFIFTS
ncbi:Ig-like domain repeat protein [Streptomyces ossamyceticus]|nr:Ig-like domain repeat protein [Streptomyces ossamyceticus]